MTVMPSNPNEPTLEEAEEILAKQHNFNAPTDWVEMSLVEQEREYGQPSDGEIQQTLDADESNYDMPSLDEYLTATARAEDDFDY